MLPDEYITQLEDALDMLWGIMPMQEVKDIEREYPNLYDLCGRIHHKVCHLNRPFEDIG